jgi:hypothetical protein
MGRIYTMMESSDIEDIKRALDLIKKRTTPLKDSLLDLLLGMTILHLSRKLDNSAIDISTTLPALHIPARNNSKTLHLPARRLKNNCLSSDRAYSDQRQDRPGAELEQ